MSYDVIKTCGGCRATCALIASVVRRFSLCSAAILLDAVVHDDADDIVMTRLLLWCHSVLSLSQTFCVAWLFHVFSAVIVRCDGGDVLISWTRTFRLTDKRLVGVST